MKSDWIRKLTSGAAAVAYIIAEGLTDVANSGNIEEQLDSSGNMKQSVMLYISVEELRSYSGRSIKKK